MAKKEETQQQTTENRQQEEKQEILVKGVPNIIAEINKKRKTTIIAPLSKAKAMYVKRYFSGSFGIDYITGGGYTYKRILLLYGHKSSGKNSQLYQMMAYNQKICRKCHGILEEFYHQNPAKMDRHTMVLRYFLNMPMCSCGEKGIPKTFVLFDYEKSLGIEDTKISVINHYSIKETTEVVDENAYNECLIRLYELKSLSSLTAEEQQEIKEIEFWLSKIEKKSEIIERIPQTDYMKNCGINIDQLLVADLEDANEGIDLIKELIVSQDIDGIIWDSLQAALPKYVKDRSAEDATMGQEAKLNGLLMRQITAAYAPGNLLDEREAYKPTVFLTSQVRSDLGAMYDKPDSYSGGNAVSHHISLALEVKREKFLDINGKKCNSGTPYYGQRTRVRAEKNKINAPGDHYFYDYFFRETPEFSVGCIDHVGEIISLGINLNVIEQKGVWFIYKDYRAQGKQDLRDMIAVDKEMVIQLCKDLYTRI